MSPLLVAKYLRVFGERVKRRLVWEAKRVDFLVLSPKGLLWDRGRTYPRSSRVDSSGACVRETPDTHILVFFCSPTF